MSARRSRAAKWGPSVVYRFYDDEAQLLYVGCTNDPERRFAEHFHPLSQSQGWRAEVAHVETTPPYPDRYSAAQAEARAILTEGPLYNDLRVIYRQHRRMFGPPCLPDQLSLIRARIAGRLGEDPGAWAYRRRHEPVRVPYADLSAEILACTNRSCTKDQLAGWAREIGPDPWADAVDLAWVLPDWKSAPANEYDHARRVWRLP